MVWLDKETNRDILEAPTLAEAIYRYIKAFDWVTFPELQNALESVWETRGTWAYEIADKNIIFWVGMSEAFVTALDELRAAKRIVPEPTSLLVYVADGGMLRLPLAKRPPPQGYKEEHWAPICLRVTEVAA